MKKTLFLPIAFTALLLSGCNERQKLSEDLQGVWAGAPETLADTGAAKASMVRLMEFNPTGDNGEGSVTMTTFITVENVMPANDSIVTPLTITASGTATISGIYQARDDDEITLSLDASSMTVNVDPQAVRLNYDVLDGESSSTLTHLKPAASVLATQQITHAAQRVFANLTEMDDIEIKKDLMLCELHHKDLTFRRQDPSQRTGK